jgi:hypothetical protein
MDLELKVKISGITWFMILSLPCWAREGEGL